MNWAIIGVGGSGRGHADEISKTEGLNLSGVYDAVPQATQEAAQRLRVKAYPSLEALLNDPSIVGATVSTPSAFHAETALALLSAGKHTLLEKPFALNEREALAIADAARKSGCLALPFHNRRWDPDFRIVLDIARSGVLGEVRVVRSAVGGPSPDSGWRLLRNFGGGRLNDWGPHLFSQIHEWFGGDPLLISGFLTTVTPENECDDLFQAEFRFAPGVLVTAMMSGFSHLRPMRWEVLGSEGTLQVTGEIHGEFTVAWKRKDGQESSETYRRSEVAPLVPIYPAIVRHLKEGTELPVSLEEGVTVSRWLEAVRNLGGQDEERGAQP